MDTAQRGMGLCWEHLRELIARTAARAVALTAARAAAGYAGYVEVEIFNAEVWATPADQTAATVRERFAAVFGGRLPVFVCSFGCYNARDCRHIAWHAVS